MLGAADGAAVDTMVFAVVDATPAESVAVALGGAEAVVVVALGGAGVDAVGTWVVVVWPKAIPVKHAMVKLQSRGEGQTLILA